jgi:hypothetical protein
MPADALAVLVGRRTALTVLAPDAAFSVLARSPPTSKPPFVPSPPP